MCPRVKILDHCQHGYVAYDREVDLFEVAFLTTLMKLDGSEVRNLAANMDDRLCTHRGRVCLGAKLFFFDSGDGTMRMALCLAEMELLHNMLEEALMTRAVDEVMEGA